MFASPYLRPHLGTLLRGLAVLLAVAAVVVTATSCAGGGSGQTSLAELVNHTTTHDGQEVRTSGTVRRFKDSATSTPYFVLEDAKQNRVKLDPADGAERYVGRHIVVEGRFTYSDTKGQQLAVTGIVSSSAPAAASMAVGARVKAPVPATAPTG